MKKFTKQLLSVDVFENRLRVKQESLHEDSTKTYLYLAEVDELIEYLMNARQEMISNEIKSLKSEIRNYENEIPLKQQKISELESKLR